MTKIFLSYRRDDTSGHVGRLSDRLCARFGRDAVFRDLDSIGPGRDFAVAINEAIGECDAVVAVIGRTWLGAAGPDGKRRIDDPEDFVRVELATALERKVRLIPVLVDRAQMPSAQSLPLPLAPLARRNSFEISESRWDYDVQRLIDVLDPSSPQTLSGSMPTVVAAAGPKTDSRPRPARVVSGPDPGKRRWVTAAAAGGLLLAVVAVVVMLTGGGDDPSVIAGGSSIPATTTSTAVQPSTTVLGVDGPTTPGRGETPGESSPAPTTPAPTTPAPTTPAPTTAATTPTTAPPPTPAPTISQAAPVTADAVAGNWSGTVSDGSGGSFLITLGVRAGCGIGQTCGSVSVSNNNCTGDFILYALSGSTYEFTVANFTSTSGPNCFEGPGEYLTPQGATLHYSTNYGPVGTLNRI